MTVYANSCELPFCCGIGSIGSFKTYKGIYSDAKPLSSLPMVTGTGLFTAEFIDNADCKKAYTFLCEKYKLLYQSPLRLNINSGRSLFMCIFST